MFINDLVEFYKFSIQIKSSNYLNSYKNVHFYILSNFKLTL